MLHGLKYPDLEDIGVSLSALEKLKTLRHQCRQLAPETFDETLELKSSARKGTLP